MHDLVHDFAQFLANNECLIVEKVGEAQNGGAWANIRHLNLLKFESKTTVDLCLHYQTEKLCSFMCTKSEIPLNMFSHLKRVKILNLNDCKLKDISTEIGNLVHMRYINLSENLLLEKLPDSICDLYNLQTLDLTRCSHLSGLPQGIHKLVSLRHLLVYGTSQLFNFTQGFEKLVYLQSLDHFNCIRGSDNKLGYLKDLNLLGGPIRIRMSHLDDLNDNVVEAKKADLKNKTFIQHLSLHCLRGVGLRVMEALQPSPNLHGLDFRGFYLPNWMTTLVNLKQLNLCGGGYENGVLHSLKNLPFLEELALSELKVERLSLEFFGLCTNTTRKPTSAFPKLMYFSEILCEGLKEWDDLGEEDEGDTVISVLPRLHRLEISFCP